MTERDPRTVFVADSAKLADAVLELLAVNGIAAEIQAVPPPPTSALTGLAEEGTPEEYPIVVTDSAKLDEARELLSTAEKIATVRAIANKRAERTGTVKATCEDCGKESEWPATSMGTTELCPHCGAYMDIPDPDDDWGEMDFGEPEADNDEE
jgi:rRNA maturation protein Nop10